MGKHHTGNMKPMKRKDTVTLQGTAVKKSLDEMIDDFLALYPYTNVGMHKEKRSKAKVLEDAICTYLDAFGRLDDFLRKRSYNDAEIGIVKARLQAERSLKPTQQKKEE